MIHRLVVWPWGTGTDHCTTAVLVSCHYQLLHSGWINKTSGWMNMQDNGSPYIKSRFGQKKCMLWLGSKVVHFLETMINVHTTFHNAWPWVVVTF